MFGERGWEDVQPHSDPVTSKVAYSCALLATETQKPRMPGRLAATNFLPSRGLRPSSLEPKEIINPNFIK